MTTENPAPAPDFVFVPELPDLIDPGEYADYLEGRLIRVEIRVSEQGVEVLGDGLRPAWVEDLLTELGGGPIEGMLCG
jgi:hypothetical protein